MAQSQASLPTAYQAIRPASSSLAVRFRRGLASFLRYLVSIVIGLIFFIPVLWMLTTALKTEKDTFRFPPRLIPYQPRTALVNGQTLPLYQVTIDSGGQSKELALLKTAAGKGDFVNPLNPGEVYKDVRMKSAVALEAPGLRWQNFLDVFARSGRKSQNVTFATYLANSLIICFFGIIGTLISNALVAYAFAKLDFPGRDILFLIVLGTIMLPFQAVMIPQYVMFNDFFHWGDTFLPIIVPAFFANAYDTFLLRQFFRTIPKELSDAARIDGASEFGIFRQIILPLAKPALVVVTITTFLFYWNDFQAPLIYLTSPQNFTMTLGLQDFQQTRQVLWNLIMAASIIFTLPIIILFFFGQKQFISGFKLSGINE